jgi:aryl-alcohol dehydrogenase-like predicted oxidoreductase
LGGTGLISAQHLYNLLKRDVEREILPACADQGMGLLCWSPLASGMLAGKYKKTESPPREWRVGKRPDIDVPRYWSDDSFRIIEEVASVAAETERTPAQVALAWLLADRRVTSVIVGARTVEQMDANLIVADWDLPKEARERISNAVVLPAGYPREWIDLSWGNIAGQEELVPWHAAREVTTLP